MTPISAGQLTNDHGKRDDGGRVLDVMTRCGSGALVRDTRRP